jgi:rSAM/selenodomain-associated transferase 2
MSLSVIVPALNESENIAKAIQSAHLAGADEVIVVDGGSGDDTLRLAEDAGGSCFQSAPGRARQLRLGVEKSRGDVLVFLHADNWFAANSFSPLQGEGKTKYHCGAFRQQIDSPRNIYRWLEWGNELRVKWRGMPYGDQAIFVTRPLYDSVGGFPDVPLMEDVMLMRKLRRVAKVQLLDGPLHVSSRRWQKHGPLQQTLRNWLLITAFRLGVSPQRLAGLYRHHDE